MIDSNSPPLSDKLAETVFTVAALHGDACPSKATISQAKAALRELGAAGTALEPLHGWGELWLRVRGRDLPAMCAHFPAGPAAWVACAVGAGAGPRPAGTA